MRITVSGLNMLVTPQTRGYVEYRFFSAAARYAPMVKAIDVVLSRKAFDATIRCSVRIELLPSGQIAVSASAAHANDAVDTTADRAGRQLHRRSARVP